MVMSLEVSRLVREQPPPPSDDEIHPENVEMQEREEDQLKGTDKNHCCSCPWSFKLKCFVSTITFLVLVIAVAAICLLTLFKYPLHASCSITWTFQEDCHSLSTKLSTQMNVWHTNETCGTGQKCLYTLGAMNGNNITGIHTTPIARYIDDLEFKFVSDTATNGCTVLGFSSSRIFYAVLDYGTNYCNLHNLIDGAGLQADPLYSEVTRDKICTQYTSSNCEKY